MTYSFKKSDIVKAIMFATAAGSDYETFLFEFISEQDSIEFYERVISESMNVFEEIFVGRMNSGKSIRIGTLADEDKKIVIYRKNQSEGYDIKLYKSGRTNRWILVNLMREVVSAETYINVVVDKYLELKGTDKVIIEGG